MSYSHHAHVHAKTRKLFFLDFAVLFIAVWIGSVAYLSVETEQVRLLPDIFRVEVVLFILLQQLILLSLGLYELRLRESSRGIFRRILVAVGLSYFLVDVIVLNIFQFEPFDHYSVALISSISLILLTLFRVIVYDSQWLGFVKRRCIVLGTGERASIIEQRMRRKADRRDFELLGFVAQPGDKERLIRREKVYEFDEEALTSFVIENGVEEVVIACDQRRNTMPMDALFNFKIRGIQITDIIDFIERETGQIAVTLIYPSWVIYSNGFRSSNHFRESVDYFFNAGLALFILLLTWPIILLTALCIYLDDGRKTGASVLYTQERVGENGRVFSIRKFRSMRPDAEKDGARFASENDDRTTRIGHFLRKYRIDELPQLFNILRGDMGFVGPRPERPEFVKKYIGLIPYYAQRHYVKPGLAGWAQLKYPYGSTDEDTLEKVKFDLYYIKHRSIMFDILILIRTLEVIVFGKGR
ncbi:TIGR03013 family XrtA/PEP-CTERM system glycosyltransferase [Saliniradius amylolyticus]|uniref:TIGR03013 family XrtA/PEP-CTERM system glycosyltransferase n=1 Tax=Saliniradius amylolyticus TaxID=2183582 RepID=UPI003B839E3E